MPESTLAAIYDPGRALAPGARRARLAAALGRDAASWVPDASALALGWAGCETTQHPGAVVVVDGDVAVPTAWAASPRAALAGLPGLRGGFAFVAWDADAGSGLIARDHLGARPVFYVAAGRTLWAASEIATLLAALPTRPGPDADELARRLAGRRGEGSTTLFAGVRELPPAHVLVLDGREWRVQRYWRPQARRGLRDADRGSAAALLRDGVRAAVARHAGPGPRTRGVLASGGLDSSAVLACAVADARGAQAPRVTAFTGLPERRELDESAYLDAMAAHCGTEVVRVPVRAGPIADHAAAHLERWGVPMEHPGGAFFLPVQAAAAARGVTVLLDGEGGDELFGCEPFLIADRLLRGDAAGAVRLARALPGMVALDARSLKVVLRKWIAPALLPRGALRRLRGTAARRRPLAPAWLGPAPRRAAVVPREERWRRRGTSRAHAHLAWLLTDARADLGMHDHLRRVAALAGVRDAHPFLDVDLVELVLGLPPELAFDARLDRPLLREAMRGLLPERVRLREDKVFFDGLLRDALTGPDRATVHHVLTGGSLQLGGLVDAASLRAQWERGPDACERGPSAWSAEIWRAFALETWLRREAGQRV